MNPSDEAAFFDGRCHHVRTPLARLPEARVLWVNRSVRWGDAGEPLDASELLARCAFQVTDETNATHVGWADRYGGNGIHHNGGSGRNVFVDGFLVKGVGRTRLVSPLTPEAHASGGAYLEECVRETILSEIARRELPFSAVPVLALLDTGESVVWQTTDGPKRERRVLLVRPPFLRPAHFERAIGFISDDPREGAMDHDRVEAVFAHATSVWGREGLRREYEELWTTWAEQMAASFVNRLAHGNWTMSNLAFDGRLADFGAMSTVPSWARIATTRHRTGYLDLFEILRSSLRSLSYYFGRFCDAALGSDDHRTFATRRAHERFEARTAEEVLRLSGVERGAAGEASRDRRVVEVVLRCIADAQRVEFDMLEGVPPHVELRLEAIWSASPSEELRELAALVNELVPSAARADARRTCRALTCARPALYLPNAKRAIYDALESPGASPDVGAFIEEAVASGQRSLATR